MLFFLFTDKAKKFLSEFNVQGAGLKLFKYGEQLVCYLLIYFHIMFLCISLQCRTITKHCHGANNIYLVDCGVQNNEISDRISKFIWLYHGMRLRLTEYTMKLVGVIGRVYTIP